MCLFGRFSPACLPVFVSVFSPRFPSFVVNHVRFEVRHRQTQADLCAWHCGRRKRDHGQEVLQSPPPFHPGQGSQCGDTAGLLFRARVCRARQPGVALDSNPAALLRE